MAAAEAHVVQSCSAPDFVAHMPSASRSGEEKAFVTMSPQDVSILRAIAEGLTNREIGARLNISHYTVKDHLTKLMRKLGTSRRAETVMKAARQGLLE